LIILDVMMPHSNGFTFAARVKGDPRFRGIPILFLTAKESPSDMVRAIQMGARGYMTKPFKIEILREKVARILA
jgi:DNA-binding response OmpR family regulator